MRKIISILIIFIFLFLAFASSEDSKKVNELECPECHKTFKKGEGWTYEVPNFLTIRYVQKSGGIFCSRWCAQGAAMHSGATSGRTEEN
jgi:hypothetical protein